MARRRNYDFKPDRQGVDLLKVLHMTRLQRLQLLKWSLYGLLCILLLVIQDTMMCHVHLSGATTDLAVCAILLISVVAGSEDGSLFALLASCIYYFSGSAPGPYVIVLITGLTVAATIFRQSYWQRGFSSTMLCAGLAMVLYEMLLFSVGIFTGLTNWGRAGVFFLTALLSVIVMLPLYPLVRVIGKIGGEVWKE